MKTINKVLQQIDQLQKIIFSIYVARDYAERHFYYEKKLQEKNRSVLIELQKLTKELTADSIQQCYEITLEISSLRYRLKDHTLLEMCYQELTDISHAISTMIECIITPTENSENSLNDSILSLENIYQNALQVALPNPIVFLIFIEALYLLQTTLTNMRKFS